MIFTKRPQRSNTTTRRGDMKVFYNKYQSSKAANSYSPSAGKPALAIADWQKHGLITNEDIVDFKPATEAELCLAHDPAFVSGVLNGSISNGFGNTSESVALSLPYTTGSLLAAARYVAEHGGHVCSPTSGFHHAGYDFAGGYCTFNGLAVTLLALKNDLRVGILDCDMHYGNGTHDILERKGYTKDPRWHQTQGAIFHGKADVGRDAVKYFEWLNSAIYRLRACDLILYQAGADPHINDPLGGLLTTGQMIERDQIVFKAFKHTPLVWNLAGGYQKSADGSIEPVLAIHRNTVIECIKASQ